MSTSQPLALGIDVGGTSTKMGLVNTAGEITAFRQMPTEATGTDPAPFLNRLYAAIDAVLGAAEADVIGLGLSMHGELDAERCGPIIAANTPALRNLDVRGLLEARYGMRVVIHNDLIAHTLGEYYFGCGHGVRRFMCLAVGTGLGAGVLVDGKPLIIDGGNSGNTGLVILDPDGPMDANGVKGSAEALCGVKGIERLALARYGRAVKARDVIAAAREQQDQTAVEIMRQIGAYLGQTLATLSVIFYPHRVALTGGTAAAGSVLLEACGETFDVLVGDFFRDIAANTRGHFREVEIVLGEQGGEAGILGSVVELLPIAGDQPVSG